MSEIANKTILELTPLNGYLESDAIPVLRPSLNQDNCISLGNIIWFDKDIKQLIINGRYKFDMSSLLQANLSIKLLGDSGITNFTYNGQTYSKSSNIESSEDLLTATITANVDSHYTFNKWQFKGLDILASSSNTLLYRFTENGELSASTTPNQYTITVNTETPFCGTVSGSGNYNYNTSHTITATPNSGYRFVRWIKNGSQVSTNSSYSFTVTEDATYTAVFEVEGPPDYYVGLTTNPTNLANMLDSDIISNAEGKLLLITPIYPALNQYKYLSDTNKLIYILIKSDINTLDILVDIDNPGSVGDLNNLQFNDVFTDENRTITENNIQYKLYRRYKSSYSSQNGFRIKFNQN